MSKGSSIIADTNETAAQPSALPLHVAWLVEGPVEARSDGSLTSQMASVRYRCLSVVGDLTARGVACSVVADLGRAKPAAIARDLRRRRADVVVAGKPLGPTMVKAARLVRRQGVRLVADFCDDWFDHPQFGQFSRALAAMADRLVASTPSLADALERRVGRTATIISDPYEGPQGVPRFAPGGDRLELLWFGNENNYPTLLPMLPQLQALSDRRPLRLTVLTAIDRIDRPQAPVSPNFLVEYAPWTVNALWRRLAACDVVVIPTLRTPYYDAKSPNRLIEAIWAGRAVAAHSIASYSDFGEFCWLGDDIVGAITAMIADPGAVERRITAGQALIARRHAPAAIAAQWLDCLSDGAGGAQAGSS
jgi:hypothetical protein